MISNVEPKFLDEKKVLETIINKLPLLDFFSCQIIQLGNFRTLRYFLIDENKL
jgi:hypothetical protein